MKKIPSWIILLGCEIIAFLFLILCGFKFTYAPEIENSWVAISAFAAWASVITSSVAIFVAIQIPQKIAHEQNKIALYEKRVEFLDTLIKCEAFSSTLDGEQKPDKIKQAFCCIFGTQLFAKPAMQDILKECTPIIWRVLTTLQQGRFLFAFDVSTEAEMISVALLDMLQNYDDAEVVQTKCKKFVEIMGKLTIKDKIKETLKLSS